jgi:hypothetical protein
MCALESPDVSISGTGAGEAFFRWQVVKQREVRPESVAGERVDRLHELPIQPASDLLIRLGRVGVSVAENEGAAGDVAGQAFDDVLAAVGFVQEPLGGGIQMRVLHVEQDRADLRPDRSPAGLSGLSRTPSPNVLRRWASNAA